eukprot:s1694_g8.t1
MLLNKERIKVCLDGTFRLSSDKFVVITVGILGKRVPVIWSGFKRGFSTSFFEGLVAVALWESAVSYCRLIDSPAADAETCWGVDVKQPGAKAGPVTVEDACWRSAYDMAVGGSASGSQPQESWHKCRLKPAVGSLKFHFDELHAHLQDFLRSRSVEASKGNAGISDAPDYCLEPVLFEGSKALRSSGRTCSRDFLKNEAVLVVEIDPVNVIYVMRKSFLWKPEATSEWLMTEDSPEDKLGGLTVGTATVVLSLFHTQTAEEAQVPLEKLLQIVGTDPARNKVQNMLRVLDRWTCVGLGPDFARYWRLESAFEEARGAMLQVHQWGRVCFEDAIPWRI